MLTSKQRAQLKALAAEADTILIIGKGGVTENVIAQTDVALRARELVKGRVLEASLLTAREVCDTLAERCRAEGVQCIGKCFVLYKRSETAPRHVLDPERGRQEPKAPAQRVPAQKKPDWSKPERKKAAVRAVSSPAPREKQGYAPRRGRPAAGPVWRKTGQRRKPGAGKP